MARYIAKERGQIPLNDVAPVRRAEDSGRRVVCKIVEAGEEFEFNGKPGKWMEPLDKGEKGVKAPKASGAPATPPKTSKESSGEQDGSGAP